MLSRLSNNYLLDSFTSEEIQGALAATETETAGIAGKILAKMEKFKGFTQGDFVPVGLKAQEMVKVPEGLDLEAEVVLGEEELQQIEAGLEKLDLKKGKKQAKPGETQANEPVQEIGKLESSSPNIPKLEEMRPSSERTPKNEEEEPREKKKYVVNKAELVPDS